MAPRKVLFVAGTLGVGGAEQQLLYMLRALIAHGHQPEVVSLEGGVFVDRIAELGVPVTVLARVRGPVSRLTQITKHIRQSRPDVVQATHNWVSAYVAIAGRVLSLPAIGALRSEPAETIQSIGLLGHAAVRLPKLIAANSTVSLEAAVAMGVKRGRLVHLPNAVDTDRFFPLAANATSDVSLLAVGRLSPSKAFDRYLDVVQALTSTPPDDATITAVLVGSGPEKANLEAQVGDLGLSAHFTFQETDDPLSFYQNADLLLFTSQRFEGMPNVVLEAMATGVPVVGFESGDVARVVIDNKTGVFVRPNGDTAAMTEAVRALISDRSQMAEFGRNARRQMEEHYSLDALADNLDRLHERAMGGG